MDNEQMKTNGAADAVPTFTPPGGENNQADGKNGGSPRSTKFSPF